MNDNFVYKSSVPVCSFTVPAMLSASSFSIKCVSPQESFSTSLGMDPSVKVTYHNLQKNTKVNTGSMLGTKTDITAFVQRITVKNNRATTISPFYIKDQIPISETSIFKVTLTRPEGLGLAKDRKEVVVAEGAKVHPPGD